MKIRKVATSVGGQDGAFWGDYLFRFEADRRGVVQDARPLDTAGEEMVALPKIAELCFSEQDPVIPHCNAVVFGTEYFAPDDEFPLMYSNIYNNYSSAEDRREGMCCVYRLQKNGNEFSLTLVQIIQIGFKDDPLWISGGETKDIRPYGNFVIDRENNLLHAFTMRDAERKSRYFSFDLPKLADGEWNETYGVKFVTLTKDDVKEWFDTDYHNFIQGACCYEGKVYSSEGFTNDAVNAPALRVIDPAKKEQVHHVNLFEIGYPVEAEFVDFRNGNCYYSDAAGNIFRVDFEA